MSKGKANRRAARGLGANGVPQQPSMATNTNGPAAKAVPKTSNEVAQPAPGGEQASASASTISAPQAVRSASTSTTTTRNANAAVHQPALLANATVNIKCLVPSNRADGGWSLVEQVRRTIPAHKLAAISNRFCTELAALPNASTCSSFDFVIGNHNLDPGAPKAVDAFVDWLNTLRLPFPTTYRGSKQINLQPQWGMTQYACLYKLTQDLDLKAPFGNSQLYARIRDYFDPSKTKKLEPAVLIKIWHNTDCTSRLWYHGLRRIVDYVDEKQALEDAEAGEEDQGLGSFSSQFEYELTDDSELHEAYMKRSEEKWAYLERQAARVQREVDREERRKAGIQRKRLQKEEAAAQRARQLADQRELLDRRGVTTIARK